MKYHILLVEDQTEIRNIVSKYLENEGYLPFEAKDGFEALEIFSGNKIHIVILDVMMPGIDGFDVLKELRKISDVPVIMLTARTEETDRLRGFDIGADDYVLKPFSAKELVKRVNALIKRTYHSGDEIVYQFEDLRLHTKSMKLYKGDEEIPVTAAEFGCCRRYFDTRDKFSRASSSSILRTDTIMKASTGILTAISKDCAED